MSKLKNLLDRAKQSPDYKRKMARAEVTADLRILIANANKSQKEVAERIGITPAALSSKLSGSKNLTLDSIVDIADAVGAAVDLVFRPADSKRAPQMWEADAMAARTIDRAMELLREVETLHQAYASAAQFGRRTPTTTAPCANDVQFKRFGERGIDRSARQTNSLFLQGAMAA